jgi:hypothetical protein
VSSKLRKCGHTHTNRILVPRHSRNFTRQVDWEYSSQSHDLWAGLIPNSGLVLIEDPNRYNLGPGLSTTAENAQVYGIAVTHQYHCLKLIRENFHGLVTRNKAAMEELIIASDKSMDLPPKVDHIFHCIDYLRQTVLCNADTTVEGQSHTEPTHIDGYGPLHECRNWVSATPKKKVTGVLTNIVERTKFMPG